MSPERNRAFFKRNDLVRVAAVAAGITICTPLITREISRRKTERLRQETLEQSAGDGNYVITPEEVGKRSGYGF